MKSTPKKDKDDNRLEEMENSILKMTSYMEIAVFHFCWNCNHPMFNSCLYFFFLLALQPPMGIVFYSPLVGFRLLTYEVS